jgi:hypothetical protein
MAINNTQLIKLQSGEPVGLVGTKKCLETLFPDEDSRPSRRWLEMQCAARRISFIKISRLIFFDVPKVREALNGQRTAQYGGTR